MAQWVDKAWEDIPSEDSELIKHSFKKCGVVWEDKYGIDCEVYHGDWRT